MNYQAPADTTFIDLSDLQIKNLHDKIFGEALISEESMNIFVKLEIAYIPFLLFILIMVVIVNYRWNKSYSRLKSIYDKMETSEKDSEKFGMLRMQKRNLLDRLFFYIVIWGISLYLDTMLMVFGFFELPYLSIPIVLFVAYKKLDMLINTNTLRGYNDTDIKDRFTKIMDKMIINPVIDGVSYKIKQAFKNKKE